MLPKNVRIARNGAGVGFFEGGLFPRSILQTTAQCFLCCTCRSSIKLREKVADTQKKPQEVSCRARIYFLRKSALPFALHGLGSASKSAVNNTTCQILWDKFFKTHVMGRGERPGTWLKHFCRFIGYPRLDVSTKVLLSFSVQLSAAFGYAAGNFFSKTQSSQPRNLHHKLLQWIPGVNLSQFCNRSLQAKKYFITLRHQTAV